MVQKLNNIGLTKILQLGLGALLLGQSVLFFTKNPEMSQGFEYLRIVGKFILPLAFVLLLLPLTIQRKNKWVFILVAIILFSDSVYLMTKNKYVFEQLVEHALKFGLPLFYVFHGRFSWKKNALFLKTLVALTFIGHGLFAMGLHFVPGGFIQMTQNILMFDVDGSRTFLFVVGLLDLLVAVCIFIKPFQLPAMVYMVFWGVLTSLARFVGYYYHAPTEEVFGVYLFETIWRTSHFLAPLILVMMYINGISFTFSDMLLSDDRKALSH